MAADQLKSVLLQHGQPGPGQKTPPGRVQSSAGAKDEQEIPLSNPDLQAETPDLPAPKRPRLTPGDAASCQSPLPFEQEGATLAPRQADFSAHLVGEKPAEERTEAAAAPSSDA